MLYNLENITDNMNFSGYNGKWYSYISNMDIYRVRLLNNKFTIFQLIDNNQVIVDMPEIGTILRQVIRSI